MRNIVAPTYSLSPDPLTLSDSYYYYYYLKQLSIFNSGKLEHGVWTAYSSLKKPLELVFKPLFAAPLPSFLLLPLWDTFCLSFLQSSILWLPKPDHICSLFPIGAMLISTLLFLSKLLPSCLLRQHFSLLFANPFFNIQLYFHALH